MRAPMPKWSPPAPRAVPGAPIAKTDERSWQDATRDRRPFDGSIRLPEEPNKAFTIEIDGLLSMRAAMARESGLVPPQLPFIGPRVGEQIEDVHLLRLRG